ncbi:hypothetical protein SM124_06335 [Bacillus sp. 31A1R]|uniref:Preprotein translocase subunit SecA n=1 Tax=Robertmurraya mangrovi TaxID=3098077 RepID=A0ABU5IW75_9BACI|nr:hypothetical protein [Bacillus sp. 31A1R]MDZ5471361.1 hypothetical protein [Bacillus sp. 31A1R]
MFVVYYYENRNQLLNQLRKQVPSVGEDIRIKGRKGKITNVEQIEENKFNVQVALETINKNKLAAVDNSKKKKR